VQVQVVQLLLLLLLHLLLLLLLPHPAFRVSAGRQLQLEAPRFSPHRGDSRQPPQPAWGVRWVAGRCRQGQGGVAPLSSIAMMDDG
jgi:hypothetical protein